MSKPSSSTNVRTGLGFAELKQAVLDHLMYTMARPVALAETRDFYHALALAVRDRMQHHWMDSVKSYYVTTEKVACYLSAEFLMGPHLGNNLVNLGIENEARQAMAELGQSLTEVLNCEEEPGLGNGGLGRLAACYLDSLATLQRPAIRGHRGLPAMIADLPIAGRHTDPLGLRELPVTNKNVRFCIRIVRHQIAGFGHERHMSGVRRHGRTIARTIGLACPGCQAHPQHLPACTIVDEHILQCIEVPRNQVAGGGLERHMAAIGRQGRIAAPRVGLRAVAGHAHTPGLPGLAIVHEHVLRAVGVVGHEIPGRRVKGHVTTVGGNDGTRAGTECLAACAGDAHAFRLAGLAIMDEDVDCQVGVTGHQIAGCRRERDMTPVAGYRSGETRTRCLGAAAGNTDPLGLAGLAIAHEYIDILVGITRHQRGHRRKERDAVTIGGNGRQLTRIEAADAAG